MAEDPAQVAGFSFALYPGSFRLQLKATADKTPSWMAQAAA